MAAGEFRVRLCYRKSGKLRFLSHLEIVRALERSSRRAGLPYAVTQGFNRRMKVAFGPALPVGSAGEREYLDLWLTRFLPADDVMRRLRNASPEELGPVEARYVHPKAPSLAAVATIARYRVSIEDKLIDEEGVSAALSAVIEEGSITTERKGKTKVFDLARCLPEEFRVRSDGPKVTVEVTLRMGQEGSLRPEVLLDEALSQIGRRGVDVYVTRTDILIEDEDGLRRPI